MMLVQSAQGIQMDAKAIGDPQTNRDLLAVACLQAAQHTYPEDRQQNHAIIAVYR
jgi:hypothetical protein